MLETYQNLPSLLQPVFVTLGPVSIHWYSLMWLAAFYTVYRILAWRIAAGESLYAKEFLVDIMFNSLAGALLGGRLGYVLFYDFPFFLANPLSIISPYDFDTGVFTGIFGMSFHGGLIGVIIALWWSARAHKTSFWALADFVAVAVPLGYFFGRIGNFLNNELYGRVTQSNIGMDFGDGQLRHPSQLYEAFGEGMILFCILWSVRKYTAMRVPGMMSAAFVLGYGVIRFIVEFFREPDAHLSFVISTFTMGQVLSALMVFAGSIMIVTVQYNAKKL